MEFILNRLSDKRAIGWPTMLHPPESCFTGGGHIVIRLPDSLQQSIRQRNRYRARFSLVFEGCHRRHIVSCILVDPSCVVSFIPEHTSCKEIVELLLYLHDENNHCVPVLQQNFTFSAADPFDIVAANVLSLSVRHDRAFSFPLTWPKFIDYFDEATLAPNWTKDQLHGLIDSLRHRTDKRLSASLRRLFARSDSSVKSQASRLEQLRKICVGEGTTNPFTGRSTVLHFLATQGLIASTALLLRFVDKGISIWTVANAQGHTPADLADQAGFTEFALLLRCPQSMQKWVHTSAETQERATTGDSVASIHHSTHTALVMTTNKEKSGLGIEQDVGIHKALEDSEVEAKGNIQRRVALNGGVSDSPTASALEAEDDDRLNHDIIDSYSIGPDPGDSVTDSPQSGDHEKRVSAGAKLVHKTDTMDYAQLAAAADHPPGSPFVLRSASLLSPETRLSQGDHAPSAGIPGAVQQEAENGYYEEDMIEDAAPSWSHTLSKEVRGGFTRKFIKRQDLIWELISTERNYVRMLRAVRDVYRDPFLAEFVHGSSDVASFSPRQAERLFPCVDSLSAIHGRLLHRLCEQQRRREDRAILDLADVLLIQFDGDSGAEMVRVYGEFYARHKHGKKLLGELRQSSPRFRAYLARCEVNPAIRRRTLEDIYLIINQRFSKVESLLSAIIENTINQAEESEKLQKILKMLKDITYRAEAMLGESENKEMLEFIVEHFDTKATSVMALNREFTLEDLKQRRILYYGKLKVYRSAVVYKQRGGSSGAVCKQGTVECLAVLFPDLFVLLLETSGDSGSHSKRYQFLKEDGPAPSVLPFAYLSNCIVRESPHRQNNEYELFLMFNHDDFSFRYSLFTRQDERSKWAKLLSEAAMNTELKTEGMDQKFGERLSSIDQKFKRGCEILSMMQKTDWELEREIDIKAALWQEYLLNWGMDELDRTNAPAGGMHDTTASSSPDTDILDDCSGSSVQSLPNLEDIEGMMKKFSQEATKLHMLIHSCNTNLTRSASSAVDQAPNVAAGGGRGMSAGHRRGGHSGTGGVHLPRRYETFAGYDSSTQAKMTAGLFGKRPSLEAATSDESVGTADKSSSGNVKSDSTLKVKHSSGRRSSLNFSNFLRNITKTSEKSDGHNSSRQSVSTTGPLSPSSPSATSLGAMSLVSPAESGGPGTTASSGVGARLSSVWDWSNEHLEPGNVNWHELAVAAGPPNRSAVLSLSCLNADTRRLIGTLTRLRTQLVAMHNRLTSAEEEARTLREQTHSRYQSPDQNHPGESSGFHVMREIEKLRNQRTELERERAEYKKDRQREIAKLETEREELVSRKAALDDERQELEEAKQRLADQKLVLQRQIDQHERRLGLRLDGSVDPKSVLFPAGHQRCPSDDSTLHGGSSVSGSGTRRDSGHSVPPVPPHLVSGASGTGSRLTIHRGSGATLPHHSKSLLSLTQGGVAVSGASSASGVAREPNPTVFPAHDTLHHPHSSTLPTGHMSRSTSDISSAGAGEPKQKHILPLNLAEQSSGTTSESHEGHGHHHHGRGVKSSKSSASTKSKSKSKLFKSLKGFS